jgi:chemotaxis protein methyltransferase CheR
VLPRIIDRKVAAGDRTLRIWSAGCSTGEEPYTIAICVYETLPFHAIWDINIYATDISTEVLTRAYEGKYNHRAVEHMPKDLLAKYFSEKDGFFYINNAVKKDIEFEYANLVDAYYESDFDIIFCRNVLIYFRDDTKRDILNRFHGSLKDDGWMFLGPTEMVRGLCDGFKMTGLKDSVAFQKLPR